MPGVLSHLRANPGCTGSARNFTGVGFERVGARGIVIIDVEIRRIPENGVVANNVACRVEAVGGRECCGHEKYPFAIVPGEVVSLDQIIFRGDAAAEIGRSDYDSVAAAKAGRHGAVSVRSRGHDFVVPNHVHAAAAHKYAGPEVTIQGGSDHSVVYRGVVAAFEVNPLGAAAHDRRVAGAGVDHPGDGEQRAEHAGEQRRHIAL